MNIIKENTFMLVFLAFYFEFGGFLYGLPGLKMTQLFVEPSSTQSLTS